MFSRRRCARGVPQLQRPLRQGALVRLRAGRRGRSSSWSCASKGAAWQKPSEPAKDPQTKFPSSPRPPCRADSPLRISASGDSPPADRLSARARHRPRRGRAAVPRGPPPSANGVSSPIGFLASDAGGWGTQPAIQGAAPRNPSRPSTGTATRRCSSRGFFDLLSYLTFAAQGDANRRHRRTQLRGQPSPRPSVSRATRRSTPSDNDGAGRLTLERLRSARPVRPSSTGRRFTEPTRI